MAPRSSVPAGLLLAVLGCACGSGSSHATGMEPDASADGAGPGFDASAVDSSADRTATDAGVPVDGATDATSSTETGAEAAVSYYGPGIGADSLDNHQVATTDVDYRFRAATTSKLLSLVWYDIYTIKCAPHSTVDAGTCPGDCAPSGSVYACGTGGDMHICIQTDDGTSAHLTTGTDLGCVDHPDASGPPYFPVETFPTPPMLEKGTLYHVHWHNTDPTPAVNFTSVDALFVNQGTVPRQPTVPDTDLAVFRGTTLRPQDTPILQLTYADATVQGQGYMEVWVGAPVAISGDAHVREQFTVSGGDRTVHGVAVRVNRASGTSALGATVIEAGDAGAGGGGGGATVAQASIPATAIPLEAIGNDTSPTWASAAFAAPVVLADGTAYDLVFSAPVDTVYQAYGLERGAHYAFTPPTFFGDGYGQFTVDGGTWSGFDQPGGATDETDADVQFYFY